MSVTEYMTNLGSQARKASRVMAAADTQTKNQALIAIAGALEAQRAALKAANALDMQRGRDNGLEPALLDRLELSDKVINSMIEGLRQVAALPDPIGAITDMNLRPSGIQVGKMRVPLGVVGII
ncbi:MAG TPA: gamma-glutamyl-phosphate reductase, partial [Cellvibrionaceae bacterium]|nr:gamma-glutamyl-phosphate reductase [Cellvibrionaceae bacterium]